MGSRNLPRSSPLLIVLSTLFLVLALTLIALLATNKLIKILGVTGSGVISRVLGVLLSALAVQYVIDGLLASFA